MVTFILLVIIAILLVGIWHYKNLCAAWQEESDYYKKQAQENYDHLIKMIDDYNELVKM
jgi:hypothetical protein